MHSAYSNIIKATILHILLHSSRIFDVSQIHVDQFTCTFYSPSRSGPSLSVKGLLFISSSRKKFADFEFVHCRGMMLLTKHLNILRMM